MELHWPGFLILLGLVPILAAVYWWILRRRRKFTIRYSSLALVRDVIPRTSRLRRHLPFAFFLLGIAALVMALTRPTATVTVPSGKANIILTIDVSRSMCSTDIPPNRLKAAKAAVTSFINRQDPNTNIGIVVFAGFAAIVQTPTSDQKALREAVEGITTARRTAIGSGILEAINAIAEVNTAVAPLEPGSAGGVQPQQTGEYAPDIIVVLSDGASNTGPMPLDAAQQAADRGLRVYTIGYGTASGASMNCGDASDAFFNGGGGNWGGNGFGNGLGGGGWRRGIDEETLLGIAEMTGGEYYSATSAGELHEVFEQLPTYLVTQDENTEISVFFVLAGMLLAGLAITLSLAWHPIP